MVSVIFNPQPRKEVSLMEMRMPLKTTWVVIAMLLVLAICRPLFADQIVMKNGDRLTGEIVRMENRTLVVETSYAGEIAIQWEQVSSIETDSVVHVVLEDNTAAHGVVKTVDTGTLQMKTDALAEPVRFSADRVAGINPPVKSPVTFKGRVNAGLDIKDGNTETKSYYGDGEIEARTEKNRYIFGGEANREEESGEETADNWLLYSTYDHFVSQKWFLYTKANFEQDDFADLNLRTTLSAGTGYQFLESEVKNLSARIGLAYVNEDYSIEGQDDDYTAGLWNVQYDHYFFDKFIQFFHNHEGIVSLEDSEDLLIRTRTRLRIPLQKGFNTTLQYNWDWDNTPAPGNERVDERYLFTLGYSWE
jgi:putative salt-induced outer membrane protein YdiY